MQRKHPLTITLLAVPLAFWVAFTVFLSAGPAQAREEYFTGPLRPFKFQTPPQKLPPFIFYDPNNKLIDLSAFKGQVVLLMLWATWCPYCQRDLPKVEQLQKELGERGLAVVAIASDMEGYKKVKEYMDAKKVSLPIFTDPRSTIGPMLGARGVPFFVLIDREGREIGRIAGETDWLSEEAKGFLKSTLN